jgi:NADPH:quinone reductase-like Zn-dependent oxidoreductase
MGHIELAKIKTYILTSSPYRSGHNPITTCSPHNFDLVKSYGAAAVFDYHSRTCAADIKDYTKNGLRLALDCITVPSSIKICYDAIGRMGGRYTAVELPPEVPGLRRVVKQDWVMGMTLTGRAIDLGKGYVRPVIPEHVRFGLTWAPLCQRLIDEKVLRPLPKTVGHGAWKGVLSGIDELRAKKVSGGKLVYSI